MEWDSKETFDDLLSFFMEKFGYDLEDENDKDDIDALKEDLENELQNTTGRFSSWGDSISITVNSEEFNLVSDESEAESIALQIVTDQAQSEPELFNQSFVSNYLTIYPTDKRIIAQEEADARLDGLNYRELFQMYEEEFGEEPDEDKNSDDLREEISNELAESIEKELDDPIQYFVHDTGIYSLEDLMNASFIRIDHEEMAEDAISADGWPHFISHYDGSYETSDKGIIIMIE